MSRFSPCSSCHGKGKFDCQDCLCASCGASGQIMMRCGNCDSGGTVMCEPCSGSGRILIKKGLFSDKYGEHPLCSGSGRIRCRTCNGSGQVMATCSACNGKRRKSTCQRCGATGTYACIACNASGLLVSEWFKSLAKLPTERLRFEYDKRQNQIIGNRQKIGIIQTKIARISAEYEQMYADYEADRRARPYLYDEAGCYPGGLDSMPREMSRLESEASGIESDIGEIESDLDAIEEVLNSRA